jgi:environmental stress-induced protein Ves
MPVLEQVSPADRVIGTWAGGVTEEIGSWGEGPTARLSVATIERAARFTSWPGRQRWLAVLDDGGGLTLTLPSGPKTLRTGDHLAFDGGAPVFATPGPRPARVWNAIVAGPPHPIVLRAEVATTPAAHTFGAGVVAVHAASAVELVIASGRRTVEADCDLLAASSTAFAVEVSAAAPTLVVWAWLGLTPIGPRGAMVAPPPVTVTVAGPGLRDWPSFHHTMARAFGFPAFYGANLDAWIDCLTYLDDPAARMTTVHAPPGGVVTLVLDDVDALAKDAPEIFAALVDGVAFVNERRRERGAGPVLTLAYDRTP